MTQRHSFLKTAVVALTLLAGCGAGAYAQLRVLYIGDSITDGGWGRSSGSMTPSAQRNHRDQNHIFGHSYMMISAATLMADRPGEYECLNRGISGNTLADLQARWQQDCLDLRPSVVSILVGTNDVDEALRSPGKTLDIKAWEERYDSLLLSTRAALPGVRLMLCTPFVAKAGKRGKAADYPRRAELVADCAKAVERLARKHDAALVPFARLVNRLTGEDSAVGAEYWIWDGIHPTPACHKKMADLWLEIFRDNL